MMSEADIGKSPDRVDEEMASEDAVMAHLMENTVSRDETEDNGDVNGSLEAEKQAPKEDTPEGDLPSRQEMWQVIQAQQEQIDHLQDRVGHLEEKLEDSEEAIDQASTQLDQAAQQLRDGKLSGEAGAELLAKMNDFHKRTKKDARAWWLYLQLVEREKVGVPVRTSAIAEWRTSTGEEPYINTKNPNQTIHRVMKHLQSLTEEDRLIGEVKTYMRKGERVVELKGGE